jgi:hypothetical protein
MSKLDAQRAMREAKYARDSASGPTRREEAAARSGTPLAMPPTRRTHEASPPHHEDAPPEEAALDEAPAEEALCGHKSMNGRACTRAAGHSEKSHRYG